MSKTGRALVTIPQGLRDPLLNEFTELVINYFEGRWTPSELSGGKFCEIVYTILDGHASGSFAPSPSKPANFVDACRRLENNSHVPRSFQILIPRMLPGLYEIRNNRNVGHVGGDVDPNHMDATVVVSMCSWIMAELIRVFHSIDIKEAQELVDSLVEYKTPLIWESDDIKRVLDPKMILKEQILVLLLNSQKPTLTELSKWTEVRNRDHFMKVVKSLHKDRLVEFNQTDNTLQILPTGKLFIGERIKKKS